MKKRIIIIGAGPAGLTAAYEFLTKSKDYEVIILEESDMIGGISRTVDYKGNRIDIGGHRFFSKNQDVLDLWNEILPQQGAKSKDDIALNRTVELSDNGPDPEKEDAVMLRRHRVSRILFLHKFFDYPISMKFSTFKNMGFIRTMKSGFGYMKSAMFKRKENSLEDYMINLFGKPLYHLFFEDYTEKVWGRNPKEISSDWGKQRIKGLSLFKMIMNVLKKPFRKKNSKKVAASLIETFSYPKKGPGQLYEELAKKVTVLGGQIFLNSKVVGVNKKEEKIASLVYLNENGEKTTISGDYFISSMPLKDLFECMGRDSYNSSAYDVATKLVYRDFMTVGLLVNKLLIKNTTKIKTINNIVPDTWIYVQEREVRIGRLQIFNNWSPYMVKDQNTVWIGLEYFCNEGDNLWNMNEKAFIEFAINELSSIKVIDKNDVLDSKLIKVKKAYPAYFDSYKDIDLVRKYIDSISNLYCIGRNGQHRYNNMDHSMLTAMVSVDCILNNRDSDKHIIWSINEEKEYHEAKS